MQPKLPKRYRVPLFALLMSFITGFVVSGIISLIHHVTITAWLRGFLIAWPLVFLSIITIAPRISRFVDGLVGET
ncbi:MAG TPA: DUF2798 domain-containing protein [Methylophilaceae bacterium]|nr:DUF2798 domain-containing protein [Methylophilaceae bacterium]